MQDIERSYSVCTTLSQRTESFPSFGEPLREIRIIKKFRLYFQDLNATKIYFLKVSVLTKLSPISFVLLLATYSNHCYNIELTF